MMNKPLPVDLSSVEARLARIESRLVQLMLHFGLDPYTKTYDASYMTPPKTTTPKEKP